MNPIVYFCLINMIGKLGVVGDRATFHKEIATPLYRHCFEAMPFEADLSRGVLPKNLVPVQWTPGGLRVDTVR